MPQNNPHIIGVTGITGSGTSTVAKILSTHGGYVIEADKLAHDLMKKDAPAYHEIIKIFGSDVLGDKNEIDRRILGERVFGDKAQMTKLENIIHPLVISKVKEIIAEAPAVARFVVIDAPLLIESGLYKICHSIWLITATDELRLSRISSRDGLTLQDVTRRINSRHGDRALLSYANVIIENDGDLASLQEKVRDWCRKELCRQ